jgi:hypothetical protein
VSAPAGAQGNHPLLRNPTTGNSYILRLRPRRTLCFYDQANGTRLRSFANGFLDKLRGRAPGVPGRVNFWTRRAIVPDASWQPDLDLTDIPVGLADGRGDGLWNGLNVKPNRPQFSLWHRDVVPSYTASEGKATASFALPDRPFDDDDAQSLSQKFVVVVDAQQYRDGGDLTFETHLCRR